MSPPTPADQSWCAVFDNGPCVDHNRIWVVPPIHSELWLAPDPRGGERPYILLGSSMRELRALEEWEGAVHYVLTKVEDAVGEDPPAKQLAHYSLSPMFVSDAELDAAIVHRDWYCPACTYLNQGRDVACHSCGGARPRSAP